MVQLPCAARLGRSRRGLRACRLWWSEHCRQRTTHAARSRPPVRPPLSFADSQQHPGDKVSAEIVLKSQGRHGDGLRAVAALQAGDSSSSGKAPAKAASPRSSFELESWPASGDIRFEGVCLRYFPGAPLALRHVTFHVKDCEKVRACSTGAPRRPQLSQPILVSTSKP